MNTTILPFLLLPLLLLFQGCSSPSFQGPHLYSSADMRNNVSFERSTEEIEGLQSQALDHFFNGVGCDDFESRVWDHLYLTLFENTPPPSFQQVQKAVKLSAGKYLLQQGAGTRAIREFAQIFLKIYETAFLFFADKPQQVIAEELAVIELMDGRESQVSDPALKNFLDEIHILFDELKTLIQPLGLACLSVSASSVEMELGEGPISSVYTGKTHPLVYGARKIMATAYQSCSVLTLPLLPASYPGVRGIVETAQLRGGGARRRISSLSAVRDSHYYLKNVRPAGGQCFDVSRNPLIYDYGGKPLVKSSLNTKINLFENSGSGSQALGIDCSGFILASMAASGLRVKSGKQMKAVYISGISSWKLRQATANGLNCFQNAQGNSPLLPGDIIVVRGHAVIVDQASADPFGLSQVRSAAQCSPQYISVNQMNFSIIQSSSSFNGVGINRMHVRSIKNTEFRQALVQKAVQVCSVQKGSSSYRQTSDRLAVLRHTLSSSCRDREMPLVGEECLSGCSL